MTYREKKLTKKSVMVCYNNRLPLVGIVLPFLLGVRLNYIPTTKIYYNFYGGRQQKNGISFTHRRCWNYMRGMQNADNTATSVVNFEFAIVSF